MSAGGRYLNNNKNNSFDEMPEQPRKKGKGGKIALIIIITLVALVAAVVIGIWVYYKSVLGMVNRAEYTDNSLSAEEIDRWANYNPDAEHGDPLPDVPMLTSPTEETEAPTETTEATEPAFQGDYITNIMVVGQSYRPGEETKLADSMILLTVNKKTNTLTMSSFLRDMYIQMPNFKGHTCGKNRINVVYNLGWKWGGDLGGMEMLALCLKNNFGIEVDHTVEVNFEAVYAVIDALGGIDLELTQPEVDYLISHFPGEHDHLVEGMNHVNGFTALCYARARKVDAQDSDIKRTARQRYVLTVLMDRVKNMSLKDVNNLAKEVLPFVITDMTDEEITSLILEMVPLLPKLKIESGTVPADGTGWGEVVDIGGYPSGVIKIDLQKNKEILQAICEVPAAEPAK